MDGREVKRVLTLLDMSQEQEANLELELLLRRDQCRKLFNLHVTRITGLLSLGEAWCNMQTPDQSSGPLLRVFLAEAKVFQSVGEGRPVASIWAMRIPEGGGSPVATIFDDAIALAGHFRLQVDFEKIDGSAIPIEELTEEYGWMCSPFREILDEESDVWGSMSYAAKVAALEEAETFADNMGDRAEVTEAILTGYALDARLNPDLADMFPG